MKITDRESEILCELIADELNTLHYDWSHNLSKLTIDEYKQYVKELSDLQEKISE